ncbi:DUF1702 family protein [Nocardiopsis tropica]|uniref:DUF1702 family protein n=1 Tax=Nocardiopsis tropica TaxID=109330 RepID=UPI00360C3047
MLQFPLEETTFASRGFDRGEAGTVARLEAAGAAFHRGYGTALDDPARAPETFPEQHGPDAGFVYEGAAMALCLTDALSLPRRTDFSRMLHGRARRSPYTAHVGAGWALARLPRVLWRPVLRQLDPLLGWLAWDGYGFHQVFFGGADRRLSAPLPGYVRHATAQGAGRALWFARCAEPERIARSVGRAPHGFHGDLWSGVALAAAFTGAAPDRVRRLLDAAGVHAPALAQGAAFAAKALVTLGPVAPDSESAVRTLAGLGSRDAAEVTDEERAALPPWGRDAPRTGTPAYAVWRSRVAARLTEGVPSAL